MTTSSSPSQVLVVGAGPTGLLLAGQLARCGVRVRIVDRNPAGCLESRALAVHARSLELLDRMGVA
ncbi:MAG: FAD-dependent monooxygenase, partial [Actinomycetota bacterium]|nr:FAD-dependent monooxygenase [Actinomycetota bacterium]